MSRGPIRDTAASALVALAVGLAACSDGRQTTATSSTTTPPTVPPTSPAPGVPHPCELLTDADFAAIDVEIDRPATDVTDLIGLATSASAACQWRGDGNWDLMIGTGGAADAFEFDRRFGELDTLRELDVGDAAYLLDRVETALPEDYDFEAGILVGDVYLKLASTSDRGEEATEALAVLAAERLASAGD